MNFFIRCSFFLLLFVPSFLAAETGFINTKSGVSLREGPGKDKKAIAKIANGERIEIVSKDGPEETIENLKSNWFKITYENKTGWAFGGFISNCKVHPDTQSCDCQHFSSDESTPLPSNPRPEPQPEKLDPPKPPEPSAKEVSIKDLENFPSDYEGQEIRVRVKIQGVSEHFSEEGVWTVDVGDPDEFISMINPMMIQVWIKGDKNFAKQVASNKDKKGFIYGTVRKKDVPKFYLDMNRISGE